ncbi:MAG: pilus assembly protein PilM [Solirubrobacteraceae bacterium]|nr:pilus assembly protein PilM [Solirubrobacteraceae bacterium]
MRIPNLPSGGRVRLGTRRPSSAVALDIGADAVVALPPGGSDARRVRQAIVHPLPVGLVVDGEVVDSDGLATELRSLFQEHGLPRDVRVGLAHPRLMVRLVELPATLDGSDLDSAVRHLATDLLPVGLDQLVVDYRRIGRVPGENGDGQQRILMAAARVDGIDRLMQALDAAGLRAQGIALSGLAMVSALDHALMPGEAILYVQAGALTNVVITEDGQPLLVRAASAGSEAIATGLAERAGISHEAARAQIATIGLGTGANAAGKPDEMEATVAQQVREGLRRVVAEVQSSRGVYAARPDACAIGGIVLTGSMTTWPGVAQALEDELHLPVVVADRESWPQIDGLGAAPERLDVVVGLSRATEALRPDLRAAGTKTSYRAGRHERAGTGNRPPLIAQVGGAMLALVLVAIVYLVVISNQVSSDRERLGQIQGELVAAEQKTAALKPYDDFAKAAAKRHDAVASVAKARFKWDRTLTEIARVAPDNVWLTTMDGTLAPTNGAPGATPVAGAPSGMLTPTLKLAGCAAHERNVPAYIDRLHLMTGVTEVGFSRAEKLDKKGEGASAVGGDCFNNDTKAAKFELSTFFKQQPAPGAAATPAATTTTTTPATPAPAAGTTPPATAPANQTAAVPTGGSR